MNLTEMLSSLRVELKDSGTLWSDDELTRAVVRAVGDVDRFFPLESVDELTYKYEVSDEAWTSAAAAGTWVQLDNKPIQWDTEKVYNAAGTLCARDTDYDMDYINGMITHISGGAIGDDESCTISYSKSRIAVDVSHLSIIRVHRVEYPVGKVPAQYSSYDFFADMLWLTGIETDAQAKLLDGKHILIQYLTKNTPPTTDADGSFPRHLDEVVIKGAAAYACLMMALKYEHQAATDFTSARTALSSIILTSAETALNSAHNSIGGASGLYTSVGTALNAAASVLDNVAAYLTGATAPSTKSYLDDGDAYLNQVTIGNNVAENYAVYAARCSELAATLASQASGYINEAVGRLNWIDRYHNEGRAYIDEATARINEMGTYLTEADRYITLATQSIALANQWKSEGTERRNEFWTVLTERSQLSGRTVVTASPRQVRT
jgi:hypothetical protein